MKSNKSKLVEFLENLKNPDKFCWQCACGCMEFYILKSKKFECASCHKITNKP